MKIKKYPHSALVVEEGSTKIVVDPGDWSPEIEKENNISAIFITHEHADHFSIKKIKELQKNNPDLEIISNPDVVELLKGETIMAKEVFEGDFGTINDITYKVFGKKHALIDTALPQVRNVGFLFNDYLYHPGDALHNPGMPVTALALPIMAPWQRIDEMLNYIRTLKPKIFFPIHEALIKELGLYERNAMRVAEEIGSTYIYIAPGESKQI